MDKQFDLMSIMLKNPQAKLGDILSSGIDMQNIGLDTEANYVKLQDIQNNPNFQNSQGKFDENKFHQEYIQAQKTYNYLVDNNPYKPSKYDVFAAPSKIDNSPQFSVEQTGNPYRITHGLSGLNAEGPKILSVEELAQTRPVYNNATKRWEKAPNDSFFDLLDGDTRILAQYDSAGTHVDPITGETIEHNKGDFKTDSSGTFYYETANGKNIAGKTVLHLSDVLTTDGSKANAIDFMDSDGLYKSPVGSLFKNAALIGSMFIPYVGPVVTGIAVTQQAMKLGSVIGKMLLGSESPTMNSLEGLSETTNFEGNKSEYAKSPDNTWCWENLINLFGDSIGQLREQRLIFKYAPALFKGTTGIKEQQEGGFLAKKYLTELENTNASKLEDYLQGSVSLENAKAALQASNVVKAQSMADAYMKDYYNLGGYISKAYMTGITVQDMFQESKSNGASDVVATAMTLGYSAAEYALLSTGIGEWILPELRASKGQSKAIIKALGKDIKSTIEKFNTEASEVTSQAGKQNLFKKIFNWGKAIANADYAIGKKTVASVVATGLGEGTEEVSEEALADLFRTMYDTANWLGGKKTSMLNMNGWFDRYMMNFVGGVVGGSVNAAASDFTQFKNWDNLSQSEALQQYIYLKRNKQADGVRKALDKLELGNKNLSMNIQTDDNDKVIGWKAANETTQDQDSFIKGMIKQQLDLVDNTINSAYDGAELYHDLSDKDILDSNTLHDLRLSQLQNSAAAGRLLENFQNSLNNYVEAAINLRGTNTPEVKADNNEGDQKGEKSPELQAQRAKFKKQMSDAKLEIKDFVEGKNSPMFIAEALMESAPILKNAFQSGATLDMFVHNTEGKHINELSKEQLEIKKKEYKNYVNTEGKDANNLALKNFMDMTKRVSTILYPKIEEYQKTVTNLDSTLESWYKTLNGFGEDNYINGVKIFLGPSSLDEQLSGALGDINHKNEIENLQLQLSLLENPGEGIEKDTQAIKELQHNIIANKYTYLLQSIPKIMDTYIKQQWINPITKQHLQTIVDSAATFVSDLLDIQSGEVDNAEDQDIYTRVMNNLTGENSDILTQTEELNTEFDKFNNYRDLLSNNSQIYNSPVEQFLNPFIIEASGNPNINVSAVLGELNKILTSPQDLNGLTIDNDLLVKATQIMKALKLASAYINAGRVDNAGYAPMINLDFDQNQISQNLWGINKTINDVAKKSKTEDWEDLPTFSGNAADAILQDIHLISQRLNMAFKINAINKGKKLIELPKIQSNLNFLKYKAITTLCDYAPDDPNNGPIIPTTWDRSDLDILQPQLQEIKELLNKGVENLTDQERAQLEKYTINIEEGVHNFFIRNNSKDLKELIPRLGNYWISNTEDLTKETQAMDAKTSLYYLSILAAIDPKSYYKEYAKQLESGEIAAIPGQEFGAMLHYANAVNGNVITKFIQSLKDCMVSQYLSADEQNRKKYLSDAGISEDISKEEFTKYISNFNIIPQFYNISIGEGVPGAGKTFGEARITVNMLKNNANTKSLLDNVYVVRPTLDGAKEFATKILSLEEGKYNTFDEKLFLQAICSNYEDGPSKDAKGYNLYSSKDFTEEEQNDGTVLWNTTLKSKSISNPPSLIIIDEITRYSVFELQAIDNFAKQYGISVLAYGDFDQTKCHGILEGALKNTDVSNMDTMSNRNNFIHSIKIGTSLRTQNSQKTLNTSIMLAAQQTIKAKSTNTVNIKLHYYEGLDSNGKQVFNGDRLFNVNSPNELPMNIGDLDRTIGIMVDNLGVGEKIGYIYQDETSPIYQYIIQKHPVWASKITPYKGDSAQGQEAPYFIIEPKKIVSENYSSTKQYMEDLYTSITRSAKGSIIIGNQVPTNSISLFVAKDTISQSETIAGAGATEEAIKEVIKKQSQSRKSILDEALKGEEIQDSEYTLRSKYNVKDNTPIQSNTPIVTNPNNVVTTQPEQPKEETQIKTEIVKTEVLPTPDINLTNDFPITSDYTTSFDNNTKTIEFTNVDGLEVCKPWITANFSDKIKDINDSQYYINKITIDDDKLTFTITNNGQKQNYEYTGDKSLLELTNNQFENIDDAVFISNQPSEKIKESNNKESDSILVKKLYTFSSFELGDFQYDGENITLSQDASEDRVDSLHGLLKLGKITLDKEGTVIHPEKALQLLAELHNLAKYTSNINDLTNKINNKLGLTEQQVRFAYKATIVGNYTNPNFSKFIKNNIDEKSYFNEVNLGDNPAINNHQIVMLVGDKAGNVNLEIPICTIMSPVTAILLTDGNGKYIFQELGNAYNNSPKGTMQEKLRDVYEIVKSNVNKYPVINKLFKLYFADTNVNGTGFGGAAGFHLFNKEWTLGNFKDSKVVIQQNFGKYSQRVDLVYSGSQELENIAKDPQKCVSSIYSSAGTQQINTLRITARQDTLNTNLKTDNVQIIQIGKNGHSFVLVSDYPGVNPSNIEDVWKFDLAYNKEHEKDTNFIPLSRVTQLYVIPPKITLEEYLWNVNQFVQGGRVGIIGNTITCYKILSALKDTEQLEQLTKYVKIESKNIKDFSDLERIITELDNLYKEHKYKEIINYLQKGGKNSYERQFLKIISLMSISQNINDSTKYSSIQENIGIIDGALKTKYTDYTIYSKAKLDLKNSTQVGALKKVIVSPNNQYRSSISIAKSNGQVVSENRLWIIDGKVTTSEITLDDDVFDNLLDELVNDTKMYRVQNASIKLPSKINQNTKKISTEVEALLNKYNIDSKGFTDDKSAYMAIQQKINSDQNSNECALYDGKNFRIVTNNCFKGNTITITDDHNIKIGGTDYALSITDKEIQFQSATVNGEFTAEDIQNFNNAIKGYKNSINSEKPITLDDIIKNSENQGDITEDLVNFINDENPFSQLKNIKEVDDILFLNDLVSGLKQSLLNKITDLMLDDSNSEETTCNTITIKL